VSEQDILEAAGIDVSFSVGSPIAARLPVPYPVPHRAAGLR
jgi:hypothetical protein